MSFTPVDTITCAPVPYDSTDPAPPTSRPDADFFLTVVDRLWEIGYVNPSLPYSTLPVKSDRESKGTTILVYEFIRSEGSDLDSPKLLVKDAMREWQDHANVKFVEKDQRDSGIPADVRIHFGPGPSSWAYTGRSRREDEMTVYLGGMSGQDTLEKRAIILHEIGHVLGMLHEHQSPVRGGDIILDDDAVFEYYGGDQILVKRQVINVFNSDKSNFSEFDPKSIMMYPIPKRLIKVGRPVGVNLELSLLDKAYIRLAYPHNSSQLLIGAMSAIGIPDSDAMDIIKPLTEDGSKNLSSRLMKVRTTFFHYNKNNIQAKALLKLKKQM